MIEGLHFDFDAAELVVHLRTKAGHHLDRSEWYEEQVLNLEAGGLKDDMQVTGGSPLANFKERGAKHVERWEFFTLLAEHIVTGEVYRLSERDLGMIELISRHF